MEKDKTVRKEEFISSLIMYYKQCQVFKNVREQQRSSADSKGTKPNLYR